MDTKVAFDSSEDSDRIIKRINEMKTNIERLLHKSEGIDKTRVELTLAELNREYGALSKLISDSSLYLPKYNQKSAQNLLKSLQSKIDDKKDNLIPKSKFSFKTSFKSKSALESKESNKDEAIDQTDSSHLSAQSMPFFGFRNLADRDDLQMSAEETDGKDILLEGLTDCEVEIRGAPNALKVSGLLRCRVFCGPITTSALLFDCKQCSLRIACQQLRVHTSSECDIYLHVTSRAIIEESKGIRFAAFDWNYDSIARDFKTANLDINTNNWQQIDDFDCLSNERPSNNWSLIESMPV